MFKFSLCFVKEGIVKKSIALLIALVFCLGVVSPALAYSGVEGQVVDSVTGNGWSWGGDVYIINDITGYILATCFLSPTGYIVSNLPADPCTYGSAALFNFLWTAPSNGDDIDIVIDFSCALSGNCSGGPVGTPATLNVAYTEDTTDSDPYNINDVLDPETGTGPNAVQLSGMGGASSLGLALVLALVAGSSLLVKKNKAETLVYIPPAVIVEGELEVQAGSEIGGEFLESLSEDL
jgi:hypothetical protein